MANRFNPNPFGTLNYGKPHNDTSGWRVVDSHATGRSPAQNSRIIAVYRRRWQAQLVAAMLNVNAWNRNENHWNQKED